MLLGAHLSIAGGLHRALERAHDYRFDCLGMFVRNQVQWKVPPLSEGSVKTFRTIRRRLEIGPIVAHASYLVNLAGNSRVRGKSITAMKRDLDRCRRLGIEYLVLHPGSRRDADPGLDLIGEALNEIVRNFRSPRPIVLLETTAGQGSTIGSRFEQLGRILNLLHRPRRFGVALDTCHVFAAGYDIRTPSAYRRTMREFDRIIGLERLRAIHLNDSLRPLGSRIDRHAHIGRGQITLRGFANLVNDPRLSDVPMILETPKARDEAGRDWDLLNADALRRLHRSR